jgi:hypothetical protein
MYKGKPYFYPSRQNNQNRQINLPGMFPPSMTQSDIISSRLPRLALPEMLRSPTRQRNSSELKSLLGDLENKLYNQHLQFHFMSVQTADIHSKVVSLIEMFDSVEPNRRPRASMFQKDYLTVFLEKLTTLVKEDSIDFEHKIKDMQAKLNMNNFIRFG